jgi:hypothetical protein
MSWIIQTILINSESIRSGIVESSEITGIVDINFFDDMYSDLLQIELTISNLLKSGKLSNLEWLILYSFSQGNPLQELVNITKLSRSTITKYFVVACDKIAKKMGREYSDRFLITKLKKAHKLLPSQVHRLKEYMRSNQRHKIRQKEYHGKNSLDS